ncbi:MAG TPA: dienelactone hydrolase family protein [Acidimicrobiales bacterium]|jgi:carboxymethylenebutenolidase|nr:dienelactone hydrolase family protein [Acidimicrobiales bacterium]
MVNNGETVEFPSNGDTASGYLATPPSDGAGPGVVVIQEWWGLVPQIRGVCDQLATEGFTALAPDLYHGDVAEHDEMDKAGHLMSTLPMDRAARDMVGAVDYLLAHDSVRGHAVGIVGFCMGGMLTLALAAKAGDKIGAAVPYYGAPLGENEPDWSGLSAPVLGHYAENDDFFPPDAVKALGEKLTDMGKDVTLYFYPGTGHAFANETNALGTYDEDATRQAWVRTLEFLRAKLG